MELKTALSLNLGEIESRIRRACDSVGRDPESVCLIAVSKTVSIDQILRLYDLGIRNFGESKIQEALPKIEQLPKDIIWHFIGPLQSNKAKKVAQNFQILHSLESDRQLAQIELQEEIVAGFVQVNVASESQKSGVDLANLSAFVNSVIECNKVRFQGLMTIGPNLGNPELLRPYFRQLRKLGDQVGAESLSMGMSGDFDVAIQEGATHIRVGSALFGVRK